MNYYPGTNELKDVCILDEKSRFWNAPNLTELLETIKTQIEEKKGKFIGTLNQPEYNTIDLMEAAFLCENPRVVENRLYVDLKILHTEKGLVLKHLIEDTIPKNLSTHFRFVLTGIGIADEDMSIRDYQVSTVNLAPFNENE